MTSNKFFGFQGQPTAKRFSVGRFRQFGESYGLYDTQSEVITTTLSKLFFGFQGQPTAKCFDLGRFRQFGESYGIYDTQSKIITTTWSNLFFGFHGQPTAKRFGLGSFRRFGESYGIYDTQSEVVTSRLSKLFFGFQGQPTAKRFGLGRFRQFGESYGIYGAQSEVITTVLSKLFFGFLGQHTAKHFGLGRFRRFGESYGIYDTQRDVADVTDSFYGTRRVILETVEPIDDTIDHTERMRQHFISQFQWDVIDGVIHNDKPVLRAIVSSIGAELDELNDTVTYLNKKRWIATAEGIQLDRLGEIVGVSRTIGKAIAIRVFGFYGQPNVGSFGVARFRMGGEPNLASYVLQDPEYRMILSQKVHKNVGRATAEDMIASLRFLFQAQIIIEEGGRANVAVAIGRQLEDNEIILANAVDLIIKAGGVGLKYKAHFNRNHYFGFLGQPNAKGFRIGQIAYAF